MIEEVKMIMDEQTKRTVDSLCSSLEEVFAPLKKLEDLDSRLSGIGGGDKLVSVVRRSIEDVQDSIDTLSAKVATLVSNQETIISSIGDIKATLDSLRNPIVNPIVEKKESSTKKDNVAVKKDLSRKSKSKVAKKRTDVKPVAKARTRSSKAKD